MPARNLADAKNGESVVIESVDTDRRVRLRLLEMGLLPGTEVKLLRRAPMGDPLQIRLRGYDLSLRAADARLVSLRGAGA